jgi:hypothetical protein
MAFRVERAIAGFLIFGSLAAAETLSVEVRHRHLHGGAEGTLSISADSVAFVEKSKKGKDRVELKFADIQQLALSSESLRILTYEDRKWQLGRDRDYTYDRLPVGFADRVRPLFEHELGRRFVAELDDANLAPLWEVGAKLRHGLGGSEGVLAVGTDRIVYRSKTPGESRNWRFEDIDTIASGGPFDLSVTTIERSGWRHAGPTEFRFQLKEELKESRYNELWRRLNASKTAAAAATIIDPRVDKSR